MISLFESYIGYYFLSSDFLVSVEKHYRNTLKNTKLPTVPATRTGQDLFHKGISIGPDPDGWETLKSNNMIWNKAVPFAARLLQSTMSLHFFIQTTTITLNLKTAKK